MLGNEQLLFFRSEVRAGVGGAAVENAGRYVVVGYLVRIEHCGEHCMIEGDLQTVLDFSGGRALHIGYEQMQRCIVATLNTKDIDITSYIPVADLCDDADLEEAEGFAGGNRVDEI